MNIILHKKGSVDLHISMTTGYPLGISSEVITQWVVMAILIVLGFILTRNLKKNPDKKQAALEKIYISIQSVVTNTMGKSYINFMPYIGSLIIYLLCLNFTGLIGIAPPTQSLSVTLGLALITFAIIHYNAIRKNGIVGYLKGYTKPIIIMLPINIMEKVMLPVSLSLRLFGNMLAATILVDLVYKALDKVANFAQLGIPIIVHSYFDVFDGTIQMLVFCMLTMIQIKLTAEEQNIINYFKEEFKDEFRSISSRNCSSYRNRSRTWNRNCYWEGNRSNSKTTRSTRKNFNCINNWRWPCRSNCYLWINSCIYGNGQIDSLNLIELSYSLQRRDIKYGTYRNHA
eukprot:TRINITY_DN4651_c0_g1_i2.p1 TRINITY_DN4651_c0_g1~~TRINITY_DN4651_c0_g1_i2.p1  ORF type:complete len:343 (-),score=2.64 TRINITY_DN4651_c0_g1_i2:203-1231(-)